MVRSSRSAYPLRPVAGYSLLLQVMVVIPEVPAFAGTIKDTSALQIIMAAQWRTINRGGASIMVRRDR